MNGVPTEKRFTLKPFITDIIVETSVEYSLGGPGGMGGNAGLLG